MELTQSRKNILKIAALTSMTVFSLFTVFMGTMAWFDAARTVNNGGDAMQLSHDEKIFKSISIHRFVTSNIVNEQTVYYFDQVASDTTTSAQIDSGLADIDFSMDKYTLLRQTNPVLALIELNETYEANSERTISMTLGTNTNTFLTDYSASQVEEMTSRPLSNIIKASAGYLTSSDSGDSGATDIADVTHSGTMTYAIDGVTTSSNQYFFSAPASYSQFVDFEDGVSSTIRTSLDLFHASNGQKVKYLYIIFDYNSDALQAIYNHFLGQTFLENDLSFQCDWTLTI